MNLLPKCLAPPRIRTKDDESDGKQDDDFDDATDSELSHLKRDPLSDLLVKILNMFKEFAIFCLIAMVCLAITNDSPKKSESPAAYPFFAKNSAVKDFYKGQISEAVEHTRMTDLSFIMFYAPWDAESQAVRIEFLKTAEFLKDNVVFMAVNCWHPGSECKNQYGKVYKWPVLIVYSSLGSGIHYNGPMKSEYMISFLQRIMRPLQTVNETILEFEEAFVVAELNVTPRSREYFTYYSTALKFLEIDYTSKLAFYVKPVKVTKNTLTLYLFNRIGTLDIKPGEWKVDTILQWIVKALVSPTAWVLPGGFKSLLLSNHLQAGPSLILFTPRNPLHPANDYYLMLQEIAQEYKNCDEATKESFALNFDMQSKRINLLRVHKNLKKTCQSTSRTRKISSITTIGPIVNFSANAKQKNADKIYLDYNALVGKPLSYDYDKVRECVEILPQLLTDPAAKLALSGEESLTSDLIDKPYLYKTSMLKQEYDPRSASNLRVLHRRKKCQTFRLAENVHPAVFVPPDSPDSIPIDLTGFDCFNQSLHFLAMDSLMHNVFAEKLGIDLSKRKDRSAVVIVDEKMESHYVMEDAITNANLRHFIRNYMRNNVLRSLESYVDIRADNSLLHESNRSSSINSTSGLTINVKELTGKNFLNVVLQKGKLVLVLYYSKQCSYCNGISYTYLTLARKLSAIGNIKFTRIDGEENILPWQYSMEEFPTILLFPEFRKEDSRVFPSTVPITVPNLLSFVLSNSDPATKLQVMYSICLQTKLQKEKSSCLTGIRNEIMSLIESTLKKWRRTDKRKRQAILYTLKQLRHLQVVFNHSPDDRATIERYFQKLKVHAHTNLYTNTSRDLVHTEL